ncbi:MAG TPA: GNAT family N-acetyltransferase [Acidimicrobiales bacterium]|jgi:phosphinothricin acetyltransferase
MRVRLARATDAEAIRSIYNAEVAGSTATFDLVPRTSEDQIAWLSEHRGPYPAIVAVNDLDTVLGFGSLSAYRDRPAYATTVEDSVYVGVRSRGAGTGRRLLEELIDLATQHGFHAVVARVGGDNRASIALHLACGFRMVGVEQEVGRKFNRWLDVSVLQRLL